MPKILRLESLFCCGGNSQILSYAQLGQLWGAEDAYLNLAASAADAAEHFRGQKDHEMEELF